MINDLTKGNVFKIIVLFTLPILIGGLFQQFYNLADLIIVGQILGENSLAALRTTSSINFLIVGFAIGVSNGFGVIIANKFGSNDIEGMKKAIGNAIVLSIIVGGILTVLSLVLSNTLLDLINVKDSLRATSKGYIEFIYYGIIASIFYNLACSMLRAVGNSVVPLIFLIIASVLNIVLDYTFIEILKMDATSAGLATILSQIFSAICGFVYAFWKYPILRIKAHHLKLDLKLSLQEFKVGVPMGLQFSITAIGAIIVMSILNGMITNEDTAQLVAFTTSVSIEQLITQPFIALAVAMSAYCGQNYGARKYDRLKQGILTALKIALVYSIIGILIMRFAGVAFIYLFLNNPSTKIIEYTIIYTELVCYFLPFLAVLFVFRNSLQGMKDSIFPTLGGGIELVARVLVSFTLPVVMGFAGLCFASPLAWMMTSIMLTIRMIYFLRTRKHSEYFNPTTSKEEIAVSY